MKTFHVTSRTTYHVVREKRLLEPCDQFYTAGDENVDGVRVCSGVVGGVGQGLCHHALVIWKMSDLMFTLSEVNGLTLVVTSSNPPLDD